jgi:carbohydrate-selective porin OprB
MKNLKSTPLLLGAVAMLVIAATHINPIEPERGSWSASYTFRQYIVERGKSDGWGLFTQLSFANKSTSPITRFFSIGPGGNGVFENRPRDEFGVS